MISFLSRYRKGGLILLLLAALGLAAFLHVQQDRIEKQAKKIEQKERRIYQLQMEVQYLKKRNKILEERLKKAATWTTRALLSETKRRSEMVMIANIIRNRVDVGWRGRDSYKGVVLDPYQFSAFNPGRRTAYKYRHMTRKNAPSPELWDEAYNIARGMILAPRGSFMLNKDVIHFYHSSVIRKPHWAYRMKPIISEHTTRMPVYSNPRIKTR